jgi:hypothetical protein
MRVTLRILSAGAFASLAIALPGQAQSFTNGSAQIPSGSGSGNNSATENVDFNDIDGDGDFDAWFADGGDFGDDRDRLWINQGGLQGGTIGTFVDDTSARLPNVQDTSRDVDFVDIDLDGDADAYVSNTSTDTQQSNRFFINQGGLQAGTAGFFVEETNTRWVNLGQNNGSTTHSSIPASLVLGTGGFIDFSCDCVFGDLDNDGDPDLVHSTYGGVFGGLDPSRIFLNDGAGFFEEFNPSGVQLTGPNIPDGTPALWANGTQQNLHTAFNGTMADIADRPLGAEIGDINGDFDLDIQMGARNSQPRLFNNRLEQNGGVLTTFIDVTFGAHAGTTSNSGNYEQEFGDMDNDNDLDLYGLNWGPTGFNDSTMVNDGAGHFSAFTVLSGSSSDDNEGEWFDYNNDGNLDLFVANFGGNDRLYENNGSPGFGLTNVTGVEFTPTNNTTALGVDSCDVDNDGDYDVMVANDNPNSDPNELWINITQVADTFSPRVFAEQADDQTGTSNPTRIRARVFDNASWKTMRHYDAVIEYSVNGGSTQFAQMIDAGGQMFTGVIPGGFVGVIDYTLSVTDEGGNEGLSSQLSFTIDATVNYCTAGTSASGCQALLSTTGSPSATAPSGFTFDANGVEGQKDGLFFFGDNGRQANPWGNSTSFNCVIPPVVRSPLLTGTGTLGQCDGAFSLDMNAVWTNQPNKNPGAGAVVQAQLWYRDPFNTANNQATSMSDAIECFVGP